MQGEHGNDCARSSACGGAPPTPQATPTRGGLRAGPQPTTHDARRHGSCLSLTERQVKHAPPATPLHVTLCTAGRKEGIEEGRGVRRVPQTPCECPHHPAHETPTQHMAWCPADTVAGTSPLRSGPCRGTLPDAAWGDSVPRCAPGPPPCAWGHGAEGRQWYRLDVLRAVSPRPPPTPQTPRFRGPHTVRRMESAPVAPSTGIP